MEEKPQVRLEPTRNAMASSSLYSTWPNTGRSSRRGCDDRPGRKHNSRSPEPWPPACDTGCSRRSSDCRHQRVVQGHQTFPAAVLFRTFDLHLIRPRKAKPRVGIRPPFKEANAAQHGTDTQLIPSAALFRESCRSPSASGAKAPRSSSLKGRGPLYMDMRWITFDSHSTRSAPNCP